MFFDCYVYVVGDVEGGIVEVYDEFVVEFGFYVGFVGGYDDFGVFLGEVFGDCVVYV